ncbi:MAG: magnesium chelatase, partial [Dehalococcoidia bacterium]
KRAVLNVFNRYFSKEEFPGIVQKFQEGLTFEASEIRSSKSYVKESKSLDGIGHAFQKLECGKEPAAMASAVEFVLEGLHLNRKLNKSKADKSGFRYQA